MAEIVGTCLTCGKTVYCDNGFLQGVVRRDGVVCFDCEERERDSERTRERTDPPEDSAGKTNSDG